MIVLTRRREGDNAADNETLEFRTFGEAEQAAKGYEYTWLRCDSCEAVTINGVVCHETGCPGARAEEAAEVE